MKISKNMKEVTILNQRGSRDKLTQNMNWIRDILTSDNYIDKTPNKMAIVRQVKQGVTIDSM